MTSALLDEKTEELRELTENETLKNLSEQESEQLLGNKKGSFLFRKDESGKLHFSGIDTKGELHHAVIKKTESSWIGLNFGNYQSKRLRNLVCLCLDCDQEEISYCSANKE